MFMKYNQTYDGEDFTKYLSYLSSIKNKLPKKLYDFVSDVNRHNFSEQSLHDAWLKTIKLETNFEKRFSNIDIVLLGAYHDREFYISFKEVSEYTFSQELQDIDRDLITFEIGFENNCYNEEQLVFRAEFSGNKSKIEIYCNYMNIDEKMLPVTMNSFKLF